MHIVPNNIETLSFKPEINGMGFQSAGIGRLCSWDRSSTGGLAVLFAGVGFFCGTAGAMGTEIGIPFAGVQVLCGGLVVWAVKYG